MKVLIAGWFSFQNGHATAGDLISRDLVQSWLDQHGITYDVAAAAPFSGDLAWQDARPADYQAILFLCGPFQDGELERAFLARFPAVPVFGINLSMVNDLATFNPFDQLWERDSSRTSRPDITFLTRLNPVPLLGVCKVESYPAGRTESTDAAIDQLMADREGAVVPIDTRLDCNATGLRSAREVETLIARMDVLITTRLHGCVLALKNGVPVVAVDPEPGGFKIKRQMETIGWPICFTAEDLPHDRLSAALDFCLTPQARELAEGCAGNARLLLHHVQPELVDALRRIMPHSDDSLGPKRADRP